MLFESYLLFLFFFFFKQKTAYEMRISDWSSDVCSSDLLRRCGKSAQTETTSRRSRFESATTGATMGFMRGRLNAQGQILTGAHAAHRANPAAAALEAP